MRGSGFGFLEADVQAIDVGRKCLETDAGPISYDSLILAPGSVTNFFGMSDAIERAIPLKSSADAERLLPGMACLEREELRVATLNTKNVVTALATVYVGNLAGSAVRVGETACPACPA